MSAPLPAALPPLAMAPPAAPRPAPSSAPTTPGLAMRIARSVPVAQSAAVVDTRVTGAEVRVTRGAGALDATAGVTVYEGAPGAMRATVVGGAGSCAFAAVGDRII